MSFRHRRPRTVRAARALLCGLAVMHLVDAVRLRRRLTQLRLAGADDRAGTGGRREPESSTGADAAERPEPTLVMPQGAEPDPRTRARAAAELSAEGLDVVDLVPGDLPVERALAVLRRVDPRQPTDDPLRTAGVHEAVAVASTVAEGLDLRATPAPADRGEQVRLAVRARRHARVGAGVRVAPELRAGPYTPRDRWREIEERTAAARLYLSLPPLVVGAETAHLLALTAGLAVAPPAAVAALGIWSVKPALVFASGRHARGGTPSALRPAGRRGAALLRLPRAWQRNLQTARAGRREARARAAARRAGAPVSAPLSEAERFEPRRETCPWCGSEALVMRLETPDLMQHKPGRFRLDECGACGHVFQNPALSPAGLDYHYEDFYDGAGEEQWEASFAGQIEHCRARVRAVEGFVEPGSWLDVGTGHGHFCLVARRRWPDAVIDGLDLGSSVEEAERRGWLDRAYRGLFPELADGLDRSYEVVSMHHYLEHTRDPRRELTAAAKVVEPGGFLMVEVPDPECPWARRLGRYWVSWFQPQHLHFVPCDNLLAALRETGFDPVSVERAPATTSGDVFFAVLLALEDIVRSPHLPWLPPVSATHRALRTAAVAAAIPPLVVAGLVDKVKDARRRPDRPGNVYRVVARRR